ncbi:MAG: SGNH/GDSL hydrolase family protein [Phascolarctobacterium sp.]|nr:SGNH/GDSL hydrolase family protein [Phascolarctobacterium sp.]
MANKIICNAEDLTAIADAVRASNGSTNTYNVPELSAAAVNAIGNGAGVSIDDTLTVSGKAADAKATGDRIAELSEEIAELKGEKKEPATYVPDLAGYLKNDGTFVTYDTCFHTDYIPLDGYIRISAKAYLVPSGLALAFFDSNKTLLKDLSIAGLGGTGSPNIIDMDVPSGASYCMLSNFFGSSNSNSDAFITLYPATEEETADSPLAGVTIDVLGDSISSLSYVTPNYWQMIAEKTKCTFNNFAVSASRIANVAGDNTESFLTRAARMDTSADAVLVMGGTNDCNLHTLLGEWDSEDESTFYGALNALITLLRTNFPGKPIIFCTPIKRKYDTDNGFPDTMADLKAASATEQITMQHCVLAIKAKCARHGIPVIDLADQSGFSPLTPEYYRADDDNLHPSALGFMRIANMVQPELEKQFAYKPD